MALTVRLLGKPAIERDGEPVAGPRGRKAWALLAYLLLSDQRPTRRQLASLLFADANDPLGALRWSLAELRRALGVPDALTGEQPRVDLPPGTVLDVWSVTAEKTLAPAELSELGGELLEGMSFPGSPDFELWLLMERHHLAGACEGLLHEGVMACLGAGRPDEAVRLATRLVSLDPLEEGHQELLVRSLATSGNATAAMAQVKSCEELFRSELGTDPSPAIRRAARPPAAAPTPDRAAARVQLEAGEAQLAAGAVETGLEYLRQACFLARSDDDPDLHLRALVALGSALVHAVRGRDQEGAAVLHEAVGLAEQHGIRESAVTALRELGYIDVQAGRRDGAEMWLARAEALAEGDAELAAVLAVQGMNRSDLGDYPGALGRLGESVERAERCGERRQAAWSLSLLGRARLLRGELEQAEEAVDRCLDIVAGEHWLAFQPWPETIRGELDMRAGRVADASERLEHAFATACQIGDPCWEGFSARAVGVLEVERGEIALGRGWLEQARTRCTRVADSYQWVHAHVLDSLARVAVEQGDATAPALVETLAALAGRTGMKEMVVRSLVHRSRLGHPEALDAARTLGAEIDNPALGRLLSQAA